VQRAKAPLTAEEIEAFYTRGEKPVGVLRVLRALDEWLLQTPADLERITYEYLQDAAAHHVRYAEFFWNPTGTVQCSGMSYAAAQQAILAGAAAAKGLRHTWPPGAVHRPRSPGRGRRADGAMDAGQPP
jgi:adenosine deaminase